MRKFPEPVVVVSECLEFGHCRYNGDMIKSEIVSSLKPFVEFRPVCAECQIGLGVPRDPIRVVRAKGSARLYQPATGLDFTAEMKAFSEKYLGGQGRVDGFIMKAYSPSCGIKGVKVYPPGDKVASVDSGAGFFGAAVLERFPDSPVEDELRLSNLRIRQHFLTKLFLAASFREMRLSGPPEMKKIVRFQADNKLLLMAYNQTRMRELGRIVANHAGLSPEKVYDAYEPTLMAAFAKAPSYVSNINVLMHAMGYFSRGLSAREKAFFLDSLEKYRNKKVPLAVPLNIVRSFIVRFGEPYLESQTYFEPYPSDLDGLADTGKNR